MGPFSGHPHHYVAATQPALSPASAPKIEGRPPRARKIASRIPKSLVLWAFCRVSLPSRMRPDLRHIYKTTYAETIRGDSIKAVPSTNPPLGHTPQSDGQRITVTPDLFIYYPRLEKSAIINKYSYRLLLLQELEIIFDKLLV